jgi:hypothetical protein
MSSSAKELDFVPHDQWPTIEQLAQGYDEYLMSESTGLANRRFLFLFENGWEIDHQFDSGGNLTWDILEGGEHTGLKATQPYKAFEVRPGIFFVNFYKEKFEEQVSMVLDTVGGRVLNAISSYERRADGETRTRSQFVQAALADHPAPGTFKTTDELVGKRMLYRYSPRDWYEHIYLNKSTLAWHCLSGVEKGLADTEKLDAWKIAEGCYLLTWSERVMPVEAFIITDLQHKRSTGSFFCWDPKPAKPIRMLFGSHAEIANQTDYPDNQIG